MKLDMGQAWNRATELVSANKDVVGIVAGVFFFLPLFALSVLVPESTSPPAADPEDFDAVMAALAAVYQTYWWAFLLIMALQMVGTLALYALLTDRARPTVGEALARGAKGFPSFIAASLLSGIAAIATGALPFSFAAALQMPAIAALGLISLPVALYIVIKFALAGPVIGIEQTLNPLTALSRSWQLTKGNSLRLFAFFALLTIVYFVINLLVTAIAGVIFAALGPQVALIGNALVANLIGAIVTTLYVAILVGVYNQFAGSSPEAISETFE